MTLTKAHLIEALFSKNIQVLRYSAGRNEWGG